MEPNGDGLRRSARIFTHRLAEEESAKYVCGTGKKKYKKDSRTWLHKSSKNFTPKTDVPPEAHTKPEKKSTDPENVISATDSSGTDKAALGKAGNTGIVDGTQISGANNCAASLTKSLANVTTDDNNVNIYHELKDSEIEKDVSRCLNDVILVTERALYNNGPRAKSTGSTDMVSSNLADIGTEKPTLKPQNTASCDTMVRGREAMKEKDKQKGVVLSDSELCLRAQNMALATELTDERDSPAVTKQVHGDGQTAEQTKDTTVPEQIKTALQVTPSHADVWVSSSSSQEKSSSKAVAKTLKKLTIASDRKDHNIKVAKAVKVSNNGKTKKFAKRPDKVKLTKDKHRSSRKLSLKAFRTSPHNRIGIGRQASRIASQGKCGVRRKEGNKFIQAKISTKDLIKKLKAKRTRTVEKMGTPNGLNPNECQQKNVACKEPSEPPLVTGEGHPAEDKLQRKRQPSCQMSEARLHSSVDKEHHIQPVPKLSDDGMRKRKGSLPANKSTSTSSIQEKRSRDSIAQDVKGCTNKRDRRPPRYKSTDTDMSSGTSVNVQSHSESSLQVQCSSTGESLEDTDSSPSSTLVQQGSFCSFTVPTPTGCLSCPQIDSQNNLVDSESVISNEAAVDDHFMLGPSPGNHCLPTVNIADLNETPDTELAESAHVLHRTKAILRHQMASQECWELVSKSDSSLEKEISLVWD